MPIVTALYMVAADAPITRSTITSGEGYFPVLIELRDHNLTAVLRGGAPHIGIGGRLDMITSKDSGATWSKPRRVVDGPEDDRNPAFGLLRNGDLLLGFSVLKGYDESGLRLTATRRSDRVIDGVYVTRSTDNGNTWSKPQRSESIHALQAGGATISSFGKMTQMSDGTVLMSVYCEFFDGRGNRSFLARSRDNGKTWGDISEIGQRVNETSILALPNGNIVAAMRSEKGQHLSTTVSRDGGRTWSTPLLVTADMQHPADLILLKNNDVLLTYGVRTAPQGVSAIRSHDGGESWDQSTRVVLVNDATNVDCGYPSSIQLSDGRIVTIYYQVEDPTKTPESAKAKSVIWSLAP